MSSSNWHDHQQHNIEQLQPVIIPARPDSKRKIDWSIVFTVVVIVTLTLASLYLAFQFGKMTGVVEEQRAHVTK